MSREDEILNSHYQLLKQTLETAKLNNIIEKGDVQIVDPAKASAPFYTKSSTRYCNVLFFGIGISLVTIFLIEFIDNTIKTIDEIEKYNKNVIGVIPAIGKMNTQGILSRYFETKTTMSLGGEKGIKEKLSQEIALNLQFLNHIGD